MDTNRSSTYAILLLLCFFIQTIEVVRCDETSITGCLETERKALLKFKDGLEGPKGRLSSWVGQDCCRWRGLRCNNKTGHVIHLNLRNMHFQDDGPVLEPDYRWSLGGEVSPSLLDLTHLTYLDLSSNNFGGIPIPSFIGSFERLRYLNLSRAGFNGMVPHQLGNLSSLRYLDLDECFLEIDSSRWLSHLYSLQYLNLGFTNLSKASDLIQSLNMLPLLLEVHLSGCGIPNLPPSLPHINFTFLSTLDLSENYINSTVPDWLFGISSLEYLDLSGNTFQDLVPATIGNLTSLKVLDLSNNRLLGGGIPTTLGNLCKLTTLEMSFNNFDGKLAGLGQTFSGCIKYSLETLSWSGSNFTGYLPDWLGDLKNLRTLDLRLTSLYGPIPPIWPSSLQEIDLSENKLNGSLCEAHFVNLTRLEYLDISDNSLVLNVSLDWVPPLQLTRLYMGSCTIGPRFPPWLRKLENISHIWMPNAGVSDNMPDWFWNFSTKLQDVDLSGNGIKGKLPNSLKYINLRYVDLSSNYFEGQLPQFSSSLQLLHLSNNSFSGTIPPNIDETLPNMAALSLSTNNINGNIPLSICKLKYLRTLDLSENNLKGEIPNCWNNSLESLYIVDLGNNNLTGGIPNSICSPPKLQSLHLGNNSLSGEFPICLKTCEQIETLDLGQNKFMGSIPNWVGEKLLSLKIFRVRSNMFVGNIPATLGNLYYLQVLDLAHNNLSGMIPHSFGNFSAMKFAHGETYLFEYTDNIIVVSKGRDMKYDKLLSLVLSIDLSDNNLSGEIPEQLATLSALQTLNLSRNHLTGKIIQNISGLGLLETLDLSENNLWGAIPPSMAALHSLGSLNLSYNNLSGKIPFSGQLQALPEPSIYIGNHDLCGFPLNTKCPGDESSQNPGPERSVGEDEDEIGSEMVWFYLSMVLGFVVGFWAVCGLLIFKKKWRIAYFRFVDNMYDRIYVAVAVNVARMKTL